VVRWIRIDVNVIVRRRVHAVQWLTVLNPNTLKRIKRLVVVHPFSVAF